MSNQEKAVSYNTTNSYSTLNTLTPETKNVWLVFHGIGYLSRYFVHLFAPLDKKENYIIAPQAPSKFYKGLDYRKVGSSWLTKENTKIETGNVLRYVDAVVNAEDIPNHVNFIVLGYSQGVSIASRWIARRRINSDAFVMVSGGFPKELTKEDFDFMDPNTKVAHIVGNEDPYFEIEKVQAEKERVAQILPQIEFSTHEGGHELNLKSIENVLF